jgi:ubiquinone/menaquinone biosynthesis C-methylase UbiE
MINPKTFWNKRYESNDYAYGTEANEFFKKTLDQLKIRGKLLLPAEGEGRNAVYAAQKGFEVTAFDISNNGKKKAEKLAKTKGVSINYLVGDIFDLSFKDNDFDAVALIYTHFPPVMRSKIFKKIKDLVKPKGYIILEGFSKANITYRKNNPKIGGPDQLDMLFSIENVLQDFNGFKTLLIEEVDENLNEGFYHNGVGKVIHYIGQK